MQDSFLRTTGLAVALCVAACAACDQQSVEQRARQAAEKMKESLPDIDGAALAQKLPADEVRHVQQQLTALKEYQGDITGELDSVTVNALQAFQRSHGLKDNGLLTDQTKQRLQAAAAQMGRAES